jgi:hypothetical protein
MKYIISESKLNDFILKYIEEIFPVHEINYTEGYDDDGNPDDSSYIFYFGDYDSDEGDETIFRWYDKDYWIGSGPLVPSRIEEFPMLYFEGSDVKNNLDTLFGEHWKPVFRKWFQDSFSLPINKFV